MKTMSYARIYKVFWLCLSIALGLQLGSCTKLEKLKYSVLKGKPENAKKILLLLHGVNSSEKVWKPYAPRIPDSYLVIGAQAPLIAQDSTHYWYDMDATQEPLNHKQLIRGMKQVKALIEDLAETHEIKENQIVLAGFGQGGTIAYELAIKHKKLINNIAIFSARLPDEKIWNTITYPNLNLFIAHGKDDQTIKLKSAKIGAFYFENHNTNVRASYDESGHYVSQYQFNNFLDWLKNPKKSKQ